MLDGTLYDRLPHDFHTEYTDAGEYVPIRDRAPSVRFALCRTVVDDSVALLFSEGHFPGIDCEDHALRDRLLALVKETKLNALMVEAATRGSIGSAAVLFRVLRNRVFFSLLDTLALWPEWHVDAPDRLALVTERYKVRGDALRAQGYLIPDDGLGDEWWFQRVWDEADETWYLPWPCSEEAPRLVRDAARSVHHGFGFVPLAWMRNLPGGQAPDGECTFRAAIETSIEIDYQLSQAGRGLKYSSDPTLLIKEPAGAGDSAPRTGGAANALVVSEKGDAKLLEINGSAAAAVIEYVRALREFALESVHGSRASAERLSAAQSGRALELMNQGLVWLADNLRISYGEDGLLTLLNMVLAASRLYPLDIAGERLPAVPEGVRLSLKWPRFYSPTAEDRQSDAVTLKLHAEAGHMSQETAVKAIAGAFDIEDVQAEIARIKADRDAADARLKELGAQVQDKTTEAA